MDKVKSEVKHKTTHKKEHEAPHKDEHKTHSHEHHEALHKDEEKATIVKEPKSDSKIESNIIDIISESLNIEGSKIVPESRLVEDLGADSLDSVEIIMAIDAQYGFDTSDEEASKISTVQDAIELVKRKISS